MPRHNDGHAPLVSVHSGAGHGGAHLPPEKRSGRLGWRMILLAVALAALVAGAVVVVLTLADSPEEDDGTPSRRPQPVPESVSSSVDQRALVECRAAWRAAGKVLAAMEPTMRQWEVHVGAMNDLVAGKITLDQAYAFWERTRVAARRRYDAFAAADRDRQPRPCGAAQGEGPAAADLAGCDRAVAAADRTLDAARTTLARWDDHITDMDRMRDGMLSPAAAQRMWLRTWRLGVGELRVYHQRERVLAAQRCTT